MSVKTDGASLKRYLSDPSQDIWPPETYYDDDEILVDGTVAGQDEDLSLVADTAKIEIRYGSVIFGGDVEKVMAMTTHFKRWLKKQTTVTLLVEVAKEKESAIRVAILAAGAKVVS